MKKRNISLLTAFAAAAALAPTAQAAPITAPTDGYTGDYRLVFATSSHPMADSSRTMTDFNADVTTAAAAVTELAALSTTWTCIGSTSTVDARDNSGTNPSSTGIPIYTTSGLRIADDNADLWDGSIQNPIMLDDGTSGGNLTGIPPAQRSYADYTWTGSNTDGTGASSGDGRQLSTDGNLRVSRGGKIDAGWISGVSIGSADSRGARFYGISDVINGGTPAADPEITSITVAGGILTIIMTGTDGTDYSCKSSTTLADGFPTTETTTPASPITTTGGTATFTVDASEAKKFYVVEE
jgi:hypothetical protein